MPEIIVKAKASIWEFRIAIFYFILFSGNCLGTAVLAGLTGVEWSTLDTQAKVLLGVAVAVNWSNTMLAFISKQATRIKQTGEVFPMGDTQFISKPISQANPPADNQTKTP